MENLMRGEQSNGDVVTNLWWGASCMKGISWVGGSKTIHPNTALSWLYPGHMAYDDMHVRWSPLLSFSM